MNPYWRKPYWERPAGTSPFEWALSGLLWALLVGVVWAGAILALWGLGAFAFRLINGY